MPSKAPTDINRNRAIGDFEVYLAPRRPAGRAESSQTGTPSKWTPVPNEDRPSRIVKRVNGHTLVRYRFGTQELEDDLAAMGPTASIWHYEGHRTATSALFGVLRDGGTPIAIVDVLCTPDPAIYKVMVNPRADIDRQTLIEVLRHLDVPASTQVGTDRVLADHFDAWRSDRTGNWELREPTMAARVTMQRDCLATRPYSKETVDVLVSMDPSHDLAATELQVLRDAREHYGYKALRRLRDLPQGGERSGFGPWSIMGDPVLVKVVGAGLWTELAWAAPEEHEDDSTWDAQAPSMLT